MLELRDYQKEAVKAGLAHLKKKNPKPGIIVLPVGTGKSLCISNLAVKLGEPVLVLQPSKEILLQNYGKAKAFGAEATIWSASCNTKELSPLTYATLGSVKKMAEDFRKMGVRTVLIDETHAQYPADPDSMFMKFLGGLPGARVLGFTATPCKLHSYTSLVAGNYSKLNMLMYDDPSFFKEMVHVTQVPDMVKRGYWAKLEYEVWDFDSTGLELKSNGAEYTQESIARCIARNGVNNTIYMRLMSLWDEREHILVAMDSVESCHTISRFINARKGGRVTAVVTADTPKKERDETVADFKAGKLKAVFNYSALSTGFDFPELDCVVFGRPTFSFSVYYQGLGRAVRPHPGKKSALIVDCCNNYAKFGRIEDIMIEKIPYKGWCMFSGERLISGIAMDAFVTRGQLLEEAERKKSTAEKTKMFRKLGIPGEDETLRFGKYQGRHLYQVPLPYLAWAAENLSFKPLRDRISEYYDKAKAKRAI